MNRTRVVTAIAAAALAAAAGMSVAPAAFADGDNTPRSTRVEIEALQWPVLKKGDDNWQVQVAKMHLYNKPDVHTAFSEKDVATVKAYQKSNDLVTNGTVDGETWNELRHDFGEAGPGSSGLKVRIVQVALNNNGYTLTVDGQFGAKVKAAVVDFQKKNTIGADGIVGPVTYRALITGGV